MSLANILINLNERYCISLTSSIKVCIGKPYKLLNWTYKNILGKYKNNFSSLRVYKNKKSAI